MTSCLFLLLLPLLSPAFLLLLLALLAFPSRACCLILFDPSTLALIISCPRLMVMSLLWCFCKTLAVLLLLPLLSPAFLLLLLALLAFPSCACCLILFDPSTLALIISCPWLMVMSSLARSPLPSAGSARKTRASQSLTLKPLKDGSSSAGRLQCLTSLSAQRRSELQMQLPGSGACARASVECWPHGLCHAPLLWRAPPAVGWGRRIIWKIIPQYYIHSMHNRLLIKSVLVMAWLFRGQGWSGYGRAVGWAMRMCDAGKRPSTSTVNPCWLMISSGINIGDYNNPREESQKKQPGLHGMIDGFWALLMYMNYMHVHIIITSHSIALPSIRVLCIALHCIALRCVALRCVALRCIHTSIPFHSIPFHSIPFHSIPFHSIPFHSIRFHSIPFHSIPFHLFHLFNFLHLSSFVYAMAHLFATRRPQVATVSHEVQTQAGGACCLEAVKRNCFRWFQASDGKNVFFNWENGSIVVFYWENGPVNVFKMGIGLQMNWDILGDTIVRISNLDVWNREFIG